MVDSVKIRWTVDPGTVAAFDPRQWSRAINRGIGRASVIIARDLKKRARAEAPVKSGLLKRGLKTRRRRIGPGHYTIRFFSRVGSKRAWYLNIVESANPFIEYAFNLNRERYRRIITDEIWRSVRELLSNP